MSALLHLLCIVFIDMAKSSYMDVLNLDILSPFERTNSQPSRDVLDTTQPFEIIYPNTTFSSHTVRTFRKSDNDSVYQGHHTVIYNPKEMLSVLEPGKPGGCSDRLTNTVAESARQKSCFVAASGGFFNHITGECYGNVVSNGRIVNTFNGKKNSGFAIRKDGGVSVGYFFKSDLYRKDLLHLVSGIGWVLRDGEDYLAKSFEYEQCNLNNVHNFVNLKTSRTFVGYDEHGYVHIVQVDGKTGESGITLHEAPKLLKSFGIINAINLNGGGASSFVVNDTLVNYPSNVCHVGGSRVLCPMNVSTILCVHLPDRCENNQHCNNNGQCEKGVCVCSKHFSGKHCEKYIAVDLGMESCCWLTYCWVVVLISLLGLSLIFNVFVCNLFLAYKKRFATLVHPVETKGDELRKYLKENNLLTSDEESAKEAT